MNHKYPRWELRLGWHRRDTDVLITGVVAGFLADLRERGIPATFTRHWRRGPHLRIVVHGSKLLADQLAIELAERVRTLLGSAEADPGITAEQLTAVHRESARLEGDTGALQPWYGHGQVVVRRPEDLVLADAAPPLADLVLSFYQFSNEAAVRMCGEPHAARVAEFFDLMVVNAAVFVPEGAAVGALAYRSHAEAYLAGTPHGRAARPRFEEVNRRGMALLVPRVGALLGQLRDDPPGHVRDWLGVVGPLAERARLHANNGDLFRSRWAEELGDPVGQLATASPFHAALTESGRWRGGLMREPWFQVYRMVVNLTYLQLTRVGVSFPTRYQLCLQVADAIRAAVGDAPTSIGRQEGRVPQ